MQLNQPRRNAVIENIEVILERQSKLAMFLTDDDALLSINLLLSTFYGVYVVRAYYRPVSEWTHGVFYSCRGGHDAQP